MVEFGWVLTPVPERMMSIGQVRETLNDLAKVEGKAELIGGRIVHFMATGAWPNEVASNIFISLREHCRMSRAGKAYTDNIGYAVPELTSGRESFSPDASYFDGLVDPKSMSFIDGPPTFAVEVRSQEDYGPAAEAEMAAKRADYFEAGTVVVWDVDPIAETVAAYRDATNPPIVYRRGQVADAEPAIRGWSITVDDVFHTDT